MKRQFFYYFLYAVSSGIYAADSIHFYRAQPIFTEPRIEREWLMSWDIAFGGGHTKHARDRNGQIVPLLDIFGNHNMQSLGLAVDHLSVHPLDLLLKELAKTPVRSSFGQLSITGSFDFLETTLSLTQNFNHGFFVEFYLPVRSLEIDDINFIDLSPNDRVFPNQSTPIWQSFLHNFDAILKRYTLNPNHFHRVGAGDLSIVGGWTNNYQNTVDLDFVDFNVKAGLLVPTGAKRNENELFSLPLGYNGHWGFPLYGSLSIGAYEWLTIGACAQGIIFAPKYRSIRMQSSPTDSGLIVLKKAKARVKKGSVWQVGAFIKADHFFRGLSLTAGYSYSGEHSTHISSNNTSLFTAALVNSAPHLQGFNMHTLHIKVEYDFTQANWRLGPRIGITYNQQCKGRSTFNAPFAQGTFGLDIVISY